MASKIIYENKWLVLREDQVTNPAGRKDIYTTVNYKHKTVGVIARDTNGDIWLVGQDRYPINSYSWEIPGGGAPPEEDVLDAAQRELREETGLTANKWSLLLRMYASNSITDEEVFVYLAEDITEGACDLEETEEITLMKIAFSDAVGMIYSGKITDSVAVAGLLRLAVLDTDKAQPNGYAK